MESGKSKSEDSLKEVKNLTIIKAQEILSNLSALPSRIAQAKRNLETARRNEVEAKEILARGQGDAIAYEPREFDAGRGLNWVGSQSRRNNDINTLAAQREQVAANEKTSQNAADELEKLTRKEFKLNKKSEAARKYLANIDKTPSSAKNGQQQD